MSASNWTKCPECKHPNETLRDDYEFYWSNNNTIVASWQNYKSELEALDLSSKTWPMNGTYVMAGLVGNGITEYKHLQRLP